MLKPESVFAHKLAIAIFHVLANGVPYADLGGAYLDKLAGERTAKQLVRRLERKESLALDTRDLLLPP